MHWHRTASRLIRAPCAAGKPPSSFCLCAHRPLRRIPCDEIVPQHITTIDDSLGASGSPVAIALVMRNPSSRRDSSPDGPATDRGSCPWGFQSRVTSPIQDGRNGRTLVARHRHGETAKPDADSEGLYGPTVWLSLRLSARGKQQPLLRSPLLWQRSTRRAE